jgi:phage terminase large subunit-like protein
VICTAQMPEDDHWLVTRSREGGDLALFRQRGWRSANAENPAARAKALASAQGQDADWVLAHIDAEYPPARRTAEEAAEARAEGVSLAEWRQRRQQLYTAFPDAGPVRRELYPKSLEFFAAGARHHERAFIAGNRVGKTFTVCYEAACHLTGWYADWWPGRRFDRPITCWAAGDDAKAVREGLQPALMGPSDQEGTGLIPYDTIGRAPTRGGIPDALDFVQVRHKAGGWSRLVFKAYEQKRKSFQSAAVDVILLDEEPPFDIYTEAFTRTASTRPGEPPGLLMGSFTPLQGISQTVLHFLPGGTYPATEELRRSAWGW